jgi:2-iminobutanoate/2-iminopropanoate deaminase
MKPIALAVTATLCLAALTMTATSQSQTGDTAYEKKSYNYAEWAKGRFSEVVTVRNAGKVIYLGGVGSEDETSAQGGVIRHLGDFGAQCRHARTMDVAAVFLAHEALMPWPRPLENRRDAC